MNLKFISETSLIEECLSNNEAAQRELYSKYAGRLYILCNRYTDNYQVAEDILQDSFIKIFDSLKEYKGEGSFEGWMKRIVIYTAISAHRSNKKMQTISIDDDETEIDFPTEENQLSRFSVKELTGMIRRIPCDLRDVLNLHIDGYRHAEIAEILNISEENSRLKLNRARNLLKKIILKSNTGKNETIKQ